MQKVKRIWVVLTAFSVVCCSLPSATLANVQYVVGLSPRGIAMGNAFSAVADDFSAACFNPAGLAQINYHQFYVGYMYSEPFLNFYGDNPGIDSQSMENKSLFKAPMIGMCLDLSRAVNVQGHELVLGMAFSIADNLKKAWEIREFFPEVPRFIVDGDYMNRLHVYASMGFEVLSDLLYVGGGLNVWQNIGAEFSPMLNVNLNRMRQFGIDIPQLIVLDEEQTEAAMKGTFEIAPIAGLLVKPLSWLSLAYNYQGSWQLTSDVSMVNMLELTIGKDQIALPMEVAAPLPITDYFLPWNMTGGIAVRPIPKLLVSVDVTYYHWSSFDMPLFDNPPGQYVKWQDTWVPRVGFEYEVIDDLFGRFGYYHQPSPIPDQYDEQSNFLSMTKNVFSCGLGYVFSKFLFVGQLPLRRPIKLDAFFQWQQMDSREQPKNPSLGQGTFWKISGYEYSVGGGVTMGY